MENLEVILNKLSEDDVKADVLPMIFSSLESNSLTLQVFALTNTPADLLQWFITPKGGTYKIHLLKNQFWII